MSYGCIDYGDHPFCSHDCCGDREECSTNAIVAPRGSLKDYPALDPNPPRGWLARLFWSEPSPAAGAKWLWLRKVKGRSRLKPRVYNLTIGETLWPPRDYLGQPREHFLRNQGRVRPGQDLSAGGPSARNRAPGRTLGRAPRPGT